MLFWCGNDNTPMLLCLRQLHLFRVTQLFSDILVYFRKEFIESCSASWVKWVTHAKPHLSSQELIYHHLICGMRKKRNVCFRSGAHKLPRVHILYLFDNLIGIIRLQHSWKEKAINRNYHHYVALKISNVNEIRIRHRRGNKNAHVAMSPMSGYESHLINQNMAAWWSDRSKTERRGVGRRRVCVENSSGRQIWGDKARTKPCQEAEMWRKAVKMQGEAGMLWSFEGACHYNKLFLQVWFLI